MSINGKLPEIPIDFNTRDYNGYFEMMKEQIPVLTPEWTDTSDTDQGIVILQLLSYGLHVLSYYQERSMMENILEYAKTKKGILTNANFLGYSPARQTPSTATLTVVKDSDYFNSNVVIPKGAKFSTDPQNGTPIIFEAMNAVTISAGKSFGYVNVKQGVTITSDILGNSNGRVNQQFTLQYPDVLVDNSLRVFTTEGNRSVSWSRVEHFLDSNPTDRHYITLLDEEDRTIIRFGDGILGMIPRNGDLISSTYRIGGGKQGDLAPNLINYVYETDFDLNFIESVRNEDFAVGGEDYEDMEVTRVKAPKHYRSRMQAITALDFQDIAELTEGVSKAKSIETYYTTILYLYLLDKNYNPASSALCSEVKQVIDSNRVGNVDLRVLPCEIKEFSIKLKLYVHDSFDKEQVALQVSANLEEDFHISKFEFGGEFFVSKIYDVAFNTAGVKNLVVDGDVTTDLTTAEYEILKLTNVIVELG